MNEAVLQKIESLASAYPQRESALMPAIYEVQRASGGYVPSEAIEEIAKALRVSRSRVYGMLTYYTMFATKPVGKYHLQVDTNIPGLLAGAEELMEHLKGRLGVEAGGTTPDGLFTLSEVEHLASCGTAPVIQVHDRYYESMTPAKADQLLASLRQGVMPDWPVQANYGSECNVLLRRRGNPKARRIETYLADGGYRGLEKALSMSPEQVRAEVAEAVLRGRGGAGFPTATKWSFLPKGGDKPVYLICNADEGEPGTFKDRQIMEFDPHLLLEGMAIAGYAIGAKLGFIYIRGEFAWIEAILRQAVEEARHHGRLGKRLLGKDVDFDVIVHLGAGSYVCGEETALIESLEGKRGHPRLKPPFPAAKGLYGCPTIVHNVETLACLPFIVGEGAAAFKKMGGPNNYGPRIFGVSGHVGRPGTYEMPLGVSLEHLLETAGGVTGRLKAVIVGGLSTPVLTAAEAAGLKLDFDGCLKGGTALGSGGVIVMNETASIPRLALRTIEFYANESCGQCTPCRVGTTYLVSLLRRLLAGQGQPGDVDRVIELCTTIRGTTLCPGGEAFSVPLKAMVTKFRPEFDALIPQETAMSGAAQEPAARGPAVARKKTVLVIDDDPDVLSFCRKVLEADGCTVNTAESAAEGIRAATSRKPDVILLDVIMEESDSGFKAAEALAKIAPIIMLTSIADAAGEIFDTSTLPIKELLQKPIAPQTLRQKVRGVLGWR